MDLAIDLIMRSCKEMKLLSPHAKGQATSAKKGQHPYMALLLELDPGIPLLDVVEDEIQVTLGRHPRAL
jgi:hypothetical protein